MPCTTNVVEKVVSYAVHKQYVMPRIIQTISEQSLQWLVRTESYERFYILPRIVPTHFAIYTEVQII